MEPILNIKVEMIEEIVSRWEANKGALRERLESRHPETYTDIVSWILELVIKDCSGLVDTPLYNNEGIQIFIFRMGRYGSSLEDFIWTHNFYGSCSGCDALENVKTGWGRREETVPSEKQVDLYMELALHLVQKMRRLKYI